MSEVRFRRAVPGDAAALADFGRRTFIEAFGADNRPDDLAMYLEKSYGEAKQRAEIADPEMITIVGESDGVIAAFAQLRRSPPPACVADPDAAELGRFYVDRPWQGSDVAGKLMSEVLKSSGERTLWLSVWERNARAIAFYAKCGFVDAGTQPFIVGTDVQTDRVMVHANLRPC